MSHANNGLLIGHHIENGSLLDAGVQSKVIMLQVVHLFLQFHVLLDEPEPILGQEHVFLL